ncbi:MAG: hypothetical protein RSB82_01380 [Victivallaceae bacterium]
MASQLFIGFTVRDSISDHFHFSDLEITYYCNKKYFGIRIKNEILTLKTLKDLSDKLRSFLLAEYPSVPNRNLPDVIIFSQTFIGD